MFQGPFVLSGLPRGERGGPPGGTIPMKPDCSRNFSQIFSRFEDSAGGFGSICSQRMCSKEHILVPGWLSMSITPQRRLQHASQTANADGEGDGGTGRTGEPKSRLCCCKASLRWWWARSASPKPRPLQMSSSTAAGDRRHPGVYFPLFKCSASARQGSLRINDCRLAFATPAGNEKPSLGQP